MEESAKAMGIEAKIWAVAEAEVKNYIDEADVLLLGPQIRYKLTSFRALGAEKGIPVEVIKSTDYGMINGKNVIEHAIELKNRGVNQ
jgi:PTS system cellobiose-specific IIB component